MVFDNSIEYEIRMYKHSYLLAYLCSNKGKHILIY